MAKKKRTKAAILRERPRLGPLSKRAASYQLKLKTLRSILGGFDAKKFDTLQSSKPKTTRAQKARRRDMQKVAKTFQRLQPYVSRSFKLARTANKSHRDALRKYVGVPAFKRLRAIPLPTHAKRVTVRFDKQGLPLIRYDGHGEKIYRFPHTPRAHFVGKGRARRWVDAQADALAMLDAMLPTMRDGIYVMMSRHQFLIPFSSDRDSLRGRLSDLYNQYASSPEFLATLFGFKWMTDSEETFFEQRKAMLTERSRRHDLRKRQRIARALKEIIAMDRQLKSGTPLTRGQTTRRAKLVQVGEPSKKLPKLSKRARATGRR